MAVIPPHKGGPRSMKSEIRIGISSCLTGEKVRYDGEHQRFNYATDVLAAYFSLVPVCPEVEVGMPVPRETIHLEGDPADPRVIAPGSGTDWTRRLKSWSRRRLRELAAENLSGYIFKKNSPSCGVYRVKVYNDQGKYSRVGRGLFAAAFTAAYPLAPVEDEDRLGDEKIRDHFIERVFAYHRLKRVFAGRWHRKSVVAFHRGEKYVLMAHSPRFAKDLDKLVESIAKMTPAAFRDRYGELFMACLEARSTVNRQVKVLGRITRDLRAVLSPAELNQANTLLQKYRQGLVPRIVPLALLKHFAEIHDVSPLKEQSYLYPHPGELMLRNHA